MDPPPRQFLPRVIAPVGQYPSLARGATIGWVHTADTERGAFVSLRRGHTGRDRRERSEFLSI